MKNNTIEHIKNEKIIAIVRGVSREDILNTATALYKGGIKLIEVTFNQKDPDTLKNTSELIKILVDGLGGDAMVGAGTVMSVAQAEVAYKSGARYLISPNVDLNVIAAANSRGIVSIPGALTPTEAATAYNNGADFVKLFPAGDFGIGYIKSVCAPLSHIPFLAVGGVNEKNYLDFINAGVKGVGVGSNLVNTGLIAEKRFDDITRLAMGYVKR